MPHSVSGLLNKNMILMTLLLVTQTEAAFIADAAPCCLLWDVSSQHWHSTCLWLHELGELILRSSSSTENSAVILKKNKMDLVLKVKD